MANLLQLVTTGAPAALTFIMGYLASPVIGGVPIDNKARIGNTLFKGLKDGILIEAESYRETERADISTQMILSVAGTKAYISDNICIHPRTWDITGYIPAEIYELSALFAPSLKKKKKKLQDVYRSRKLTWLKTRECEIVQVAIESIEFETRASVANKQPISIVLKEVKILSAGSTPNPSAKPQPDDKTVSGRPVSAGRSPATATAYEPAKWE